MDVREKTIAFLSPVSFFKGGAERSLFDLMENPSIRPILIVTEEGPLTAEAARRGIDFRTISFGSVSSIRRPLRLGKVSGAMLDWLRAAIRLARLSRAHHVDIVHSNGLKAHAVACLARRLGGAPNVPHIRDIAISGLERRVWFGLARLSDHTVLVSRACWPGEALPANVSVVYNSMQEVGVQLPRPIRITTETVVGVCGRIHPFKGIHLAVDWVAAARDRGIGVRLVIRGEAAPEEAEYVRLIEEKAVALDLTTQIVFEGRKDGLAAIYGGLDAVLVPSDTPDPLPRAVMESIALGLPVIGYPAGGIVEMIDPGRNGWLADSGETFCAAVVDINALGPRGMADLRRRSAETVQERFSRTRMFAELDAIYDRVVEAKVGGGS